MDLIYNIGMTKESVFLIFFVIFAILAGNFVFNGGYINKNTSCGTYQTQQILFGEKIVDAEISDNDCKRIMGLSGRKELKNDTAMLFVFEDEASQDIWMKDMNFSIDIVWVNSNQEIVLIKKNVSPETYPEVFGENVFSKFVIELPSGFADVNNLKVGDNVSILVI